MDSHLITFANSRCFHSIFSEEVVEKGLVIQEKEKLYSELKAILARQPVQ